MGVGAFAEPLVVIVLLFGGTWINRNKEYRLFGQAHNAKVERDVESFRANSLDSPDALRYVGGLLETPNSAPTWRKRRIGLGKLAANVVSPNTRVFKGRFLSRLLVRFPFLLEAWYWALIYWVSSNSQL